MSKNALILCGGKGTRFRAITSAPKVLTPYKNGLFIDWLIDYILKNKIKNITLSVGYRAKEIIEYVEQNFKSSDIKINFCLESTQLGTGGAIQYFFQRYNFKEAVVFNGDTYWPNNLPNGFLNQKLDIALCLTSKLKYNDRFGQFQISNGHFFVKRGTDRNPLINSNSFVGICRVNRIMNFKDLIYPYSLEDLLTNQQGGVDIWQTKFIFHDFGTVQAYKQLLSLEDE